MDRAMRQAATEAKRGAQTGAASQLPSAT